MPHKGDKFIRGHCGSVTIEAPMDRATGCAAAFLSSIHCKEIEVISVQPTLSGKSSRQGCACFQF